MDEANDSILLKPDRPVGIVGYGAYVPRYRLPAKEVARVWSGRDSEMPIKEKAVAGLDEDTATMSIEAARNALARAQIDPHRIRAVWVGSESHPYAVKPTSTIVAEALDIVPLTQAADWEFACKAGTEALQAAIGFVGSGMATYALSIGMDTAQGRPGDALEYTAASGGAAILVGPADESLARFEASISFVTDTPDFWRRAHVHYPSHGQRFTGEPAYFHHVTNAAQLMLEGLGRKPSYYRYVVLHQPNTKFPQRAAKMLGFKPEQIETGMLVSVIGNTYAGSSLVGLTAVLDEARPGDKVLVVSFGSGAGSDAFSLEVTERADALYVGNMLSGELVGQEHLGALIADFVGLRGIEVYKVEAACGSGGAALRTGFMAVAGGIHDVVIVAGVEKMTDTVGRDTTAALAMAADQEYEAAEGVSFVALNALLMRRYMYEYDIPHGAFGYFAMNAHQNGVSNPNAMFRQAITLEGYRKATMIADPINLMDSSPICDGAAAIVLASEPVAQALRNGLRPVRLAASAVATDSLAVHDRRDPTWLEAAWLSSRKAYDQARIAPADVDLFELHDAFTIMGALSLEACGFAERGKGVRLAEEGEITIEGRIPIATMGGLKARGHPVGATGVYQAVEATLQLRGLAGANQVHDATVAMTQNIGGSGATILTHILVGE